MSTGPATPGPIGECDNAPRVAKYVAVSGYRHSGFDLVGMRIHDIKVVADLTRHDPDAPDPEEPEESDGTVDGCYAEVEPSPAVQSLLDDIQGLPEQVVAWWEGWWPRIHLSLTVSTPAGGTATLHVSVDLLCDFRVEGCEIDTPVDDRMTDAQEQSWAVHVAEATAVENTVSTAIAWSSVALLIGLGVVDTCMMAACLEPAAKVALMLGYYAIWSRWITLLLAAYGAGAVTADFVVGLLGLWLGMALSYPTGLVGYALIVPLLWHVSEDLFGKLRETYRFRLLWGIVAAAFNFFIVASMWFVWTKFYEISVREFMEVQ